MSTTFKARGELDKLKRMGSPIPEACGPVYDSSGDPTRDPNRAKSLPSFGGLKGFLIAAALDALAGVLSGSCFADRVPKSQSSHVKKDVGETAIGGPGAFFAILDPGRFRPEAEFAEDLACMMTTVFAGSSKEARIPGQRTERVLAKDERIHVAESTLSALRDVCAR